ncbi:hypothetical protein EDC04DRAFT_2603161 [Pisolithus marmoratus]|nr:hypothetical protein EDC04DRAFT_2603161 [Pisolithus marmoratus]
MHMGSSHWLTALDILQTSWNKSSRPTWFMDSRAEGICYHKYFNPLPLPLLAFILTAIQCAIDEWATGEHSGVKFQGAKYADIYQHHLKNLDGWKKFNETMNDNALERLWCDLLETAWLADITPDLLASTASLRVTLQVTF